MRIQVRAPARLHFGLLRVPGEGDESWLGGRGSEGPARYYGGAGLMVEAPAIQLYATPARTWSAEGPLAERALTFARGIDAAVPRVLSPLHLVVEQAPAEHSGLGTGTQLGLAVARALTVAGEIEEIDLRVLAGWVERGRRSAIGVHGFARGGFLIEGGKKKPDALAPLLVQVPFPESWRVVLVLGASAIGRHGDPEQRAFRHLLDQPAALIRTDILCRLVLLGLLPALMEQDLEAFGEALHDFNTRAGEAFAPVQGGTYCSPRVAELIGFLQSQGVRGVGQSSWGPAVFAVVGDEARAQDLARQLRDHLGPGPGQVLVTQACNQGASVAVTD